MKLFTKCYNSPLGSIQIQATEEAILALNFVKDKNSESNNSPKILKNCLEEIDKYFKGKIKSFSVPLAMQGTKFQVSVWQALKQIPYGQTCSYQDIAQQLHKPNAYRAVGLANKKNPLPILIPCHRVVGKNGHLTGYNKGLWRKKWLIEHEQELL